MSLRWIRAAGLLVGTTGAGCASPAPISAPAPASAAAPSTATAHDSENAAGEGPSEAPCEVANLRAAPEAYVDACELLAAEPVAGPIPLPPAATDWRPAPFERGTLFMPPIGWLIAGESAEKARVMAVDLTDPTLTANVSCSVDDWFPISRAEVIEMGDIDGMPGTVERRELTVAGQPVLEQRYYIDSGDGIVVYPQLQRWHAFGDQATVASCSGNGRDGFEEREPVLQKILDAYQPPARPDAKPTMPRWCREFDGPSHGPMGDSRPVALVPLVRKGDELRVQMQLDLPAECGAWFHVLPLGGGAAGRAYVDVVEQVGDRFHVEARVLENTTKGVVTEPGRPVGIPTDAVLVLQGLQREKVELRPPNAPADLSIPGRVVAVVDLRSDHDPNDPDFVFALEETEGRRCLRLYRHDTGEQWAPATAGCG